MLEKRGEIIVLSFLSKKSAKKKVRIPKTTQQSIPYSHAFEDGILLHGKNTFSKSFAFKDINYQVGKQEDQEEVFAKYCEFLNFFDNTVDLQVTISNKNFNKEDFEEKLVLKSRDDHLEPFRTEYNAMLKKLSDRS